MQPITPNDDAKLLDNRRRLLILWFASFASVLLYAVIVPSLFRPGNDGGQGRMLTFALTSVAGFLLLMSAVFKQKFLAQAVVRQEPRLVQTAYVVAYALCEACALLGLVDLATTGNRFYYVLLMVGGIGILFHFPRLAHLRAAAPDTEKDWYRTQP
jgi:hypothetical protein